MIPVGCRGQDPAGVREKPGTGTILLRAEGEPASGVRSALFPHLTNGQELMEV